MSKSNAKYKTVCLYDAEKKTNICKTLTISNFKNRTEMEKYATELRKKQREKNKLYRESHKLDRYNKYINEEVENPEDKKEEFNTMVDKTILKNIDDFMLDPKTGNSTVIYGSSKRGKTTLMMRLYKQFYAPDKKFISTLYCGNCQIKQYKNNKNLLITSGFGDDHQLYIRMQKYINMKTNNHYKFLNLFDDIIDTKYKKLVDELILTYRNSNISSIICLQYTYLLSKMNRANANNFIIFGMNSDESIKDMINTFLKTFFLNLGLKSYKDQYNFFKDVTKNYGFFYINNVHDKITMHRIINK